MNAANMEPLWRIEWNGERIDAMDIVAFPDVDIPTVLITPEQELGMEPPTEVPDAAVLDFRIEFTTRAVGFARECLAALYSDSGRVRLRAWCIDPAIYECIASKPLRPEFRDLYGDWVITACIPAIDPIDGRIWGIVASFAGNRPEEYV
uniref:Uncharacterized protein n=1 Tax=viral metagenome TaxID=1070528 RepID=A0A6M3JI14_9ZZZZ